MSKPSCLILICGLPGSGKTTRAKEIAEARFALRHCPDEWMQALGIDLYDTKARKSIEALQWRIAKDALRCGTNVIVEWGTWAREERDALRREARALGSKVELHVTEASEDEIFERIRRRGMEIPPITRSDVARWMTQFEPPSPEERALFDASEA